MCHSLYPLNFVYVIAKHGIFFTPKNLIQVMKWLSQIDQHASIFEHAFGHLTSDALNWKPNDRSLNIGQCLHIVVEENSNFFPILQAISAGNYVHRWQERLPLLPSIMGTFARKRLANCKTQTTELVFDEALLTTFSAYQQSLRQHITALSSSDLNRVVTAPKRSGIVYPVSTVLTTMLSLEWEAFLQAQEVLISYEMNPERYGAKKTSVQPQNFRTPLLEVVM